MNRNLRILARVAVFAALVYILSYFSVFLYNVNFGFFVIFAAGFLWGIWPGIGTALIGYFIWSSFNPFGPVPFPILISQLVGASAIALIGVVVARYIKPGEKGPRYILPLVLAGFMSGLLYHIPVDIVDALVYQPFWPRLIGGSFFSLITIVSCSIIFPMFYPVLGYLYGREKEIVNGEQNY